MTVNTIIDQDMQNIMAVLYIRLLSRLFGIVWPVFYIS